LPAGGGRLPAAHQQRVGAFAARHADVATRNRMFDAVTLGSAPDAASEYHEDYSRGQTFHGSSSAVGKTVRLNLLRIRDDPVKLGQFAQPGESYGRMAFA